MTTFDDVLAYPDTAEIPEGLPTLIREIIKRTTVESFGKVITFLNRLPMDEHLLTMQALVDLNRALIPTDDFSRWGSQHAYILDSKDEAERVRIANLFQNNPYLTQEKKQ